MRAAFALALISVPLVATADRIVLAPTATKLLHRQARIEFMGEWSKANRHDAFLGVGVTKDIEVEFQLNRFDHRASLGTFSFSYLFTPAIVDTAPGLALGVQDAMDRTREGRMYYVAFTYRSGLDGDFNSKTPLELTMGAGFGRRHGMFAGVMLPFTWSFRGFAEHDLRRFTCGFEYQPLHGLGVRAVWRESETLFGVRFTKRF